MSDGFSRVLKQLGSLRRDRKLSDAQEELYDIVDDADKDDNRKYIRDIDDLYDDCFDYLEAVNDDEGSGYSDRDLERAATITVIEIKAALLADNDDDLYDDLTAKEAKNVDKYLELLDDITDFVDNDRKLPRDRRNRDRDRKGRRDRDDDRRGRRDRGRDDDDRDDRRSSRRSKRSDRMEDGVPKRAPSQKQEVETKPKAPDLPSAIEITTPTAQIRRPNMSNKPTESRMVPQNNQFLTAYYTVGIDDSPWRKLYRASNQIPMFQVNSSSTPYGTANIVSPSGHCWQIVMERLLSSKDDQYRQVQEMQAKDSASKHLEHLFFSDTVGRTNKEGSDVKLAASILDNLLPNIKELPANELQKFVVRDKLSAFHYHVNDMIVSTTGNPVLDMINHFEENVDASVDIQDVMMSGVVLETTPYSFESTVAVDAFIEGMRNKRTHNTLARSVLDLRDHMSLITWRHINKMLTDQFNEIMNVCLGLHITIESYALDMPDAIDYIQSQWGEKVVEWLDRTVQKMLDTTLSFTRVKATSGDEEYQVWSVSVQTLLVRLPCYAADLDLAVSDPLGVATISSSDNREFYEGIKLIMERSRYCRYVKMVTIDDEATYLYETPVSNAILISRHRNTELGPIMQANR